MNDIQLSDHFTLSKLVKFTLPSIVMMIVTSLYCVVDGIFVANFVGKTQFASVNLIMPFLMMFGCLGSMLGTGGSALVAKTLGEGKKEEAHRTFSMLIYVLILCGAVLSVVGFIFIEDIAVWLGAEGDMVEYCVTYAMFLLPVVGAYMLQNAFQALLVTAERPKMGMAITIGAGVTNIFLDWLFIVVFGWGIKGAALASAMCQVVGGIVPLVYFALPNKSLLRLTKFHFNGKALLKAATNGSSELVTNVSMSLVIILYNLQLMKYIGENGVAAFGVIMYINYIFVCVFIGYAIGCAPIISYNFGAQNAKELQNVHRKSIRITAYSGILLTVVALLLSAPLVKIFVGFDSELYNLTVYAFRLYILSFLFAGFNIYSSAFFTALNNGLVSAGISFSRTIIFECGAVLLLPLIFGINGIWFSIGVAEVAAMALSVAMLVAFRKRYNY